MRNEGIQFYIVVVCLFSILITASGARSQTALTTRLVENGLSRPVFATSPSGDFRRLFIVEQRGSGGTPNRAEILILDMNADTLFTQPFHAISPVNTGSEEGLLGLAFHPDYDANRYFYTYHTNTSGNNIVTRWQTSAANPDSADPTSGTTILTLNHPLEANHNGGWIAFGPDGYFYIATGDGGGGGDEHDNGQNLSTLLGKLLRIDVNSGSPYTIPPSNPFVGGPAREEIFYWGLRNPWRNAFDRETGELYIGDVGQGQWEEVNWRPASDTGNINFGWPMREGTHCYAPSSGCDPMGISVLPIHEYSHTFGCSITGGYSYRGCAIPDLHGTYFFGDYCDGSIWSFRWDGSNKTDFQDRTSELGIYIGLTSFAEDNYGEIYLVGNGQIRKIVPDEVFADCNGNQIKDSCEIEAGVVPDVNTNGIPDACEQMCGDLDGDLVIAADDVMFLIDYIFDGGPVPDPFDIADTDCNSILTISDGVSLINYLFAGGPAPCSGCP